MPSHHHHQPVQPTLSLTTRPKPKPTFLTLPPEIRLHIYDHLLPRNRDIYFLPSTARSASTGATLPSYRRRPGPFDLGPVWPAILRVCRAVHAEAADALYGANTFHFCMSSVWADLPVRENQLPVNTLAFLGPGAARRLRRVEVEIRADTAKAGCYRRVQEWVRDAVALLGGQGSRLRELRVRLESGAFEERSILPGSWPGENQWELVFVPRSVEAGARFQFVLEPLEGLCVERVRVEGHVEGAWRDRLENRVRERRKRKMSVREYGERVDIKKKRKGSREKTAVTTSLRPFHAPVLDWGSVGVFD